MCAQLDNVLCQRGLECHKTLSEDMHNTDHWQVVEVFAVISNIDLLHWWLHFENFFQKLFIDAYPKECISFGLSV